MWFPAQRSVVSEQLVRQGFILDAKLGRAAGIGIVRRSRSVTGQGRHVAHQRGAPNRARTPYSTAPSKRGIMRRLAISFENALRKSEEKRGLACIQSSLKAMHKSTQHIVVYLCIRQHVAIPEANSR